MFFIDLLVALVVALLMTAIFVAGFRSRGPWGVWWVFLLVVFMAAWAGGAWITPFGPTLFDAYWLPVLVAGFFFALLLVAAAPPAPPRTRAETIAEARAEEETAVVFGVFLWVLLIGLALTIVLAYV